MKRVFKLRRNSSVCEIHIPIATNMVWMWCRANWCWLWTRAWGPAFYKIEVEYLGRAKKECLQEFSLIYNVAVVCFECTYRVPPSSFHFSFSCIFGISVSELRYSAWDFRDSVKCHHYPAQNTRYDTKTNWRYLSVRYLKNLVPVLISTTTCTAPSYHTLRLNICHNQLDCQETHMPYQKGQICQQRPYF